MDRITADAETLMRQAPMTVADYLQAAIKDIDHQFNTTGYAKAHPELVGAYLQASALDYLAGSVTAGLQQLAESVESAGEELATRLNNIAAMLDLKS